MNELLFFATIVVNFSGTLLAYKLFDKMGLYAWIAFATMIANIELLKCIDLFGMSVTLGNVIYGTVFLATDILSENYGGKEARKGVFVGFFAMFAFVAMSQLCLLFTPNSEDFANESLKVIFGLVPRMCFASIVTYLISNTLDTYTFEFIRKKFPKHVWLRNNGSTMTSQLIDTFLFGALAFLGTYPVGVIVELCLTSYILKLIISACDTPMLYAAKKIHASRENAE